MFHQTTLIMIKLIIFAIASAGIIRLSWKSLHNLNSYGLFRFFAFESLLVLILLNAEHWFYNPLSIPQVISWLLLLSSIIIAANGFYLLHAIGKPKHGIENTTVLISRGIYKYIRHPLYSSLLLLSWGTCLKNLSLFSITLALIASVSIAATARIEEKENLQKFGADYAEYMKKAKLFMPFLV